MTVITQTSIVRREFAGYEDPALPTRIWEGSGTVTGNGTGGFMEADLVFNLSTAPRDANFYSLEHIMFFFTSNTSPQATLRMVNLGSVLGVALRTWTIGIGVLSGVTGGAIFGRELAVLPIFMGRQFAAGVTSLVSMATSNIDLIVMTFQAQGYVWGPRSINTPGGPSRPLQGVF